MGYEFKFKESEARMMKTFITGVLFVFMVAASMHKVQLNATVGSLTTNR